MLVSATTESAAQADADTVVVGLVEGEGVPHDVDGALGALLDSGEAKAKFRKVAVTHAAGKRWILVGLGGRDELDAERCRVAAAVAVGRARELGTHALCWEAPHKVDDRAIGALVEGTLLAAYRFDRYHTASNDRPGGPQHLIVSDHHDRSAAVARAATIAEAVNQARDLQNTPANDMTPSTLAARAEELADEVEGLRAEILGPAEISERGMGALEAVAQGSDEEARVIVLRYAPEDAKGPHVALVGKAVTFDSGGISIKPAGKMHEMKFDMSGGAAVLEATGAIARLGLPVRVTSVIGATENLPSGHAIKPGDIVFASNGTTIEVNNTDAEGRLVLSDCLHYAVQDGAERLVDVATLTGAVLVALGSTYAGLVSNDDDWAHEVAAAADATGELVWRLPLHPEFREMIKGRYGDIVNATEQRKAGTIIGGAFLERFVDDRPWVHLDIAGTAWDLGRAYARKGGAGYGVRLLVELAERVAAGE